MIPLAPEGWKVGGSSPLLGNAEYDYPWLNVNMRTDSRPGPGGSRHSGGRSALGGGIYIRALHPCLS